MRFLKLIFLLFLILFSSTTVQADFGNRFIANRRLANPLDSSSKKLSIRFTCQEDMTLTAASVYCMEAISPPAYRISLQENNNGSPSGVPLSFARYVPLRKSWSTVPFQAVQLIKGRIYHLVLEQDQERGGDHPVGVIGATHYASFLSTDILNHVHPNDGSPDPQANTLLFEGARWKELNQEPVYVAYGMGFQAQGNPYDDPSVRPVHGSGDANDKSRQVLQGQVLHFHCGFWAKAFAVRVRKQGNPKAPLNYQILKHDFQGHRTGLVYSAVALTPDQAPPDFKWVTIGFDRKAQAFSNFSPECWYLVFQTDSGNGSQDSPGCEDCYLFSDVGNSGGLPRADDLTFDGGAHLSRATSSRDGGSPAGWFDEFERDMNYVALGPTCPPFLPVTFVPIPTPLPLGSDRRFKP